MKDLYRTVVQASLDGFWIVDVQGRFLNVNQAYCDLVGYTREELLSMSIPDVEANEDPEQTRAHIESIIATGRDRFITRHRRKDGKEVDVEVSAHFLPDDGGLFFVSVRDATERVHQEQKLLAEALRLRTAVESSPVSILLTDAQGRIEYVNPAFTRTTGYAPAEAIGSTPALLKSGAQDESVYRALWQTILAGKEWAGEVVNRRRDGSLYTQELAISPLRDADGGISGFVGIGQDVTERRRAEVSLQDTADQLIESQSVAMLGSYRLDVESGTWTCTPVLDAIFGIAGREFPRDTAGWLSLVHPEEREELARYLMNDVLARHRRFDRTYRIVRASDGGERWVHGLGNLKLDAQGHAVEMFGTIQDVTDQKKLEDQFRQAQKMEAVGQLTSGIAHDFNNILAVVMATAELLAMDLPDEGEAQADLEELAAATRRGRDLVQRLLSFSRQGSVTLRPVRPHAVLRNVEDLLRRLLPENIMLRVDGDATTTGRILADPGALEQILVNLGTNARDAMPTGGTLTLECSHAALDEGHRAAHPWVTPGDAVCITVTDTGHGMDPATRDRAMEPFFTTKPQGMGTGLGLAMAYGLIRQHNGIVDIESEPGHGTAVRLYVPLAHEGDTAEDASVAARSVHGDETRGSESILIVEDDSSMRRAIRRALAGRGYSVLEAGNGEEALSVFKEHQGAVDLVIADLVMPRLGGPQLADALEGIHGARVKTLFMSGYAVTAVADRHGMRPDAPFLRKPSTLGDLFTKVREVLDAP